MEIPFRKHPVRKRAKSRTSVEQIVHIRHIKILTWHRLSTKPLYLVLFSLHQLSYESYQTKELRKLQFWSESLGAML